MPALLGLGKGKAWGEGWGWGRRNIAIAGPSRRALESVVCGREKPHSAAVTRVLPPRNNALVDCKVYSENEG